MNKVFFGYSPRFLCVSILSAMVAILPLGALAESAFLDVELTYPEITSASLQKVRWGDPGCVAIGGNEILFSEDGISWARVHSFEGTVTGLVYGNGIYFAFGRGILLKSQDGQSWQNSIVPRVENKNVAISTLVFDGTQFALFSSQGTFVSNVGANWESRPIAPKPEEVFYANGLWFSFETWGGEPLISRDLQTWSAADDRGDLDETLLSQRQTRSRAVGAVFGAGLYVIAVELELDGESAGYRVYFSDDGLQWTRVGNWGWPGLNDLVYVNGKFLMSGGIQCPVFGTLVERMLWTSDDGKIWENKLLPANDASGPADLISVTGRPGKPYVAVSEIGEFYTSADAVMWQGLDDSPRGKFEEITYLNDRYIAVGGRQKNPVFQVPSETGIILSSSDGENWQASTPEGAGFLRAVTYGQGIWVVAGNDGAIFTSTDGIIWVDRSLNDTTDSFDELVYGNGRFVAFVGDEGSGLGGNGGKRIYHSVDGEDWEMLEETTVRSRITARFLNGTFIAVGRNGVVTSADGLTWSRQDLSIGNYGNVAFGKERYVIGTSYSTFVSTDAVSWNRIQKLTPQFRDLEYLNGWFLKDGREISRDGVYWQSVASSPLIQSVDGIAFGPNGQFVASRGSGLLTGRIELEEITETSVIAKTGVETPSEVSQRYRLWESDDLDGFAPFGEWRTGTGDYLLWDRPFTTRAKFWYVESEPLE